MEYNKEWEYGTPSNCDCENNFIHVDCGCKSKEVCECENILLEISKLKSEDIVLQREIDAISGASISGVTEEEVDAKIASAKTEIEAEIPSLDGYATEDYVNAQISSQTSDFVTGEQLSSYTYDKATIDEKIAEGGIFDPTQYYTTAQTVNLVESAVTRVEGEIPTVPTDISAFNNDAGYITGVDLSNYATTGDVANVSTALTRHASDNTVHVSSAEKSTWSSKANVWCGSEADWALISGGTLDSNTIYLVY